MNNEKTYKIGTLTYTSAGILLLSIWMLWGDLIWSMRERAVGPSSTLLFKQIVDSEFLYGLIIIAFPNFTNIFLQPIIGFISDRHRGRLGRRIPFILFTTPFIVIGLYGLALTKLLGTWLHGIYPAIPLNIAQLIFFSIAWVFLDFGSTLASSLFTALANDVIPREVIGRMFGLFRLVSLGVGMLYNYFLIGKVEEYTFWIFFGVGTLYGLGLLLLCLKVKEGKYPPPEELPPLPNGEKRTIIQTVTTNTVIYFRQSFSMAYYRWFILATVVANLAFMPINGFSIQYSKAINIPTDVYGKYVVASYCVSLVLSYFLGVLSDKFHPLRTGILSQLVYALLMLAGFFIMVNTKAFSYVFITHVIISGCYFTFVASLNSRILPQGIFAQFISAIGIVSAVFNVIAGPVIGKIIDLAGDYRYTLLLSSIIAIISALLLIKVFFDFKKYGGDENYQAPMPE